MGSAWAATPDRRRWRSSDPPTYPSSGHVESSQFSPTASGTLLFCLRVFMFLVAFHEFFSIGPASMATKV